MLVMTKLSKQLQRDNVLKIETDQEKLTFGSSSNSPDK